MPDQYGKSNKATGRKPGINKHPGPGKEQTDHFSVTKIADANSQISQTKSNMAAVANHKSSMPITDRHQYKRQDHAPRPSGPIQSFVGNKLDTNPGKEPSVKKADKDGNYC